MAERGGQERRDVLGLVVGDLEAVGPPVAGHRLLRRELGLIGDAIGWIGPHQVCLHRFAEDPPDVGLIGRVTTQQPMVAEGVQIAAADGRLVGEIRGVIGVNEAGANDVDAGLATEVIEERPKCVIGGFKPAQQQGQRAGLRIGHRADRIERREDERLF